MDGHKPVFRVTTKLDSTIYTQVLQLASWTTEGLDNVYIPLNIESSLPPPALPSAQDPELNKFFSVCENLDKRSTSVERSLQHSLKVGPRYSRLFDRL